MARQDTHLTQTGAEVQALLDKVEGIEAGAQVNKVERLVINGNVLTPGSDKSIVILLKTLASQRLDESGDVVQGPFTIVPTSMLCAAKSLNFTAIIFNVSREMVGLWVCKSGNDNSDKFYRVLSTSNAKCYKSSNYHILDAANPGNYYALVIAASNSVTFTTENISSGDRTEQTAITIADRGYVDTAVAAKYTKPASGIPASDLASDVIPDVSNFITKSVDDLVNYYLKSETYTKAEVAALIGAIQQFHYEIYASTASVTNPQGNVLYLIGPTGSGEDRYEEYVYDSTKATPWVKIGDTSIDLSGFVTISDLNTALSAYTTSADLSDLLDAKQDVINDLDDIRDGAAAGATAYQKPQTGIPETDLSQGVRESLNKADEALQPVDVNEEDIDLNASGQLQIANRPYNAQQPDGMGYKILRKNASFASQVTEANTIYEIRHNFNLNGGSVAIPSGCVLKFNGGKLSNGEIDFNDARIDAKKKCLETITPATNSIFNSDIRAEWFGVLADGVTDNIAALDAMVNFAAKIKKTNNFRNSKLDNPVLLFSDTGLIKISSSWVINTPCNIVGFPNVYYVGSRSAMSGAVIITEQYKNHFQLSVISDNTDFSDNMRFGGICLKACYYSEIEVRAIKGFLCGVLFANNDAETTALVKIKAEFFENVVFPIDVDIKNNAWPNGIEVYGFMAGGGNVILPSGLQYGSAIRFTGDDSYGANSWRIHDIALEGRLNGTYPFHLLYASDDFVNNSFRGFNIYNIRTENTNGGVSVYNPVDRFQINYSQAGDLPVYVRNCGVAPSPSQQSNLPRFDLSAFGFYINGAVPVENYLNWRDYTYLFRYDNGGVISNNSLLANKRLFVFSFFNSTHISKTGDPSGNANNKLLIGIRLLPGQILQANPYNSSLDALYVTDENKNILDPGLLNIQKIGNYYIYANTTYGIYYYNRNNSELRAPITLINKSSNTYILWYGFSKDVFVDIRFYSDKQITFEEEEIRSKGTTANRPVLANNDYCRGFEYFDIDLGKMIVWNGTNWVNMAPAVPTISTDITADATSDTKTASPKAVKTYVDNAIPTVPTALSQLSDDSTHRLVTDTEKNTWNGKQNALTFDSTPTANSTNPVTSGGVKSYVDGAIPTVPTISTDIATDKDSTTKTASPSAVYNEVHPAIATTQPAGGFLPNVVYDLGTLTGSQSFTLATASDATIANAYFWTFEAGSTAPTITWPANITWAGGSAPTISANKHYEIMIRNGYGTFIEI